MTTFDYSFFDIGYIFRVLCLYVKWNAVTAYAFICSLQCFISMHPTFYAKVGTILFSLCSPVLAFICQGA